MRNEQTTGLLQSLKNVDVDLRNHVKMLEEKWKPKLHVIEPFKPIC